jgi:hypothetical protein
MDEEGVEEIEETREEDPRGRSGIGGVIATDAESTLLGVGEGGGV